MRGMLEGRRYASTSTPTAGKDVIVLSTSPPEDDVAVSFPPHVDTTLPAIGFVAMEWNADIVAAAALQAHDCGHAVFVILERDGLLDEHIPFTRVLEQHRDIDCSDDQSLRAALAVAAESHALPGLVFYGAIPEHPDFDQVPDMDSSGFVVDGIDSPTTRQSLLVGIPAYNEAADIADVVRDVCQYAGSVLVVDDGSADATAEHAESAGAIVVRHGRNRGYGSALRTIFHEATDRGYRRVVTIDADGQHEPSDIPQLIEHQLKTGAEVVIGSRFVNEAVTDAPLYRRIGLKLVNALANLSIGLVGAESRIRDTQSGFRCYNRRAIANLAEDRTIGTGMSASTDILYHASHNRYLIEEVPTTIYYEVENASTHNPFIQGFGLTRNLLRTIERDRPLSVLAIPGFVLVFGALVLGLWIVSYFLNTGIFLFSMAVLSGIAGTTGVFVGLAGIVLHTLKIRRKQS